MTFFIYHAFVSLYSYFKYKKHSSLWHIGMCLGAFLFSLCILLNVSSLAIKYGNELLWMEFFLGFATYACYLCAIDSFLGLKKNLLYYPKIITFAVSGTYLATLISSILFDFNFIFNLKEVGPQTIWEQSFYVSSVPSVLGTIVGLIAVITVFYSSFIIVRKLLSDKKREYLLIIGVFISLYSTINDILLGSAVLDATFSLFCYGMMFEAFRLMNYYQEEYVRENTLKILQKEESTIQQMAVTLNHELNTPLAILKSKLDLSMKKNDISKIPDALEEVNKISKIIAKVRKLSEDKNRETQSYRDNTNEDDSKLIYKVK